MKIHFTKKEYRQLLDLVFLGDWVASVDEEKPSPYDALREKIYAHAKDFGFDDLIEYDKSEQKHFETAAFEDQGVMELLEYYQTYIRQNVDE